MSRICRNKDDRLSEQGFLVPNFDEFSREQIILKSQIVKVYSEDFFIRKSFLEPELGDDTPRGNKLWTKIKYEHQNKIKNLYKKMNYKRMNDIDSEETQYLTNNIFPEMVAGLVECLKKGDLHNTIKNKHKFRFDAVDFMAEYMYNHNQLFKERIKKNNSIFEIFNDILEKNPRSWIPKSWNWSKDEAAIVIQKNVRGWFVRKLELIQDMRKFWKIWEKPYGTYWANEIEQLTRISKKQTEMYPEITFPAYKREGQSYDIVLKQRNEEIDQFKNEKVIKERFEKEFKKSAIQTEKRM